MPQRTPVKNLTRTICLTLAVLLGSLVTGCGADFDKGFAAYKSGDFATALGELRPLSEQGHADAQFLLGAMYSGAQGVLQDYKTAVKWWTPAAEQGHVGAQTSLGLMYQYGTGVPQDNVYAYMWWQIAAASGYKDASKNRDNIAKEMTPAQIEKAKKLARECIAKEYKGC